MQYTPLTPSHSVPPPPLLPPTCMMPLEGLVNAKTGACVRDDAKQGRRQTSVQGEGTLILQDFDEYLGETQRNIKIFVAIYY